MNNNKNWLENFRKGDAINFIDVMNSRILFYPGARFDGQPIKTFNRKHMADVFIYADYGVSKDEVISELTKDIGHGICFGGYNLIELREIAEQDICPCSWVPHYKPTEEELKEMKNFINNPFGLIAIYERHDYMNDDHGQKRFAVIYLGADGIATYDALFANSKKAPEVLVVQDHGFGLNYNAFGKGSALENIAKVTNVFPKYILNAEGPIWDGYNLFNDEIFIGGMHGNTRKIYIKK